MSNILTDIGTRVGQELKADRTRITALEEKSPVITLSGDVTGSATLTNLGPATLSVTVLDDSHNHVISNVDGLQTALDGKAATTHTHTVSEITDFVSAVDTKIQAAVGAVSADIIDDAVTGTTKTWSSSKIDSTKQNTLVSGTNIKTIDNISILGGGNITLNYAALDGTGRISESVLPLALEQALAAINGV